LHAIAATSQRLQTFMSTTVRVLENTPGTRSGTESLPEVFLHDNFKQIDYHYFFAFLIKKKWEAGLILHSKTCFFQHNWKKVPPAHAQRVYEVNPIVYARRIST
jgi:hypothetical protein